MEEKIESNGKIKKLFRRLEDRLSELIQGRLDTVNAQIPKIEASLDKKYGGMYKILIHEFLNNQEEKIYNLEIQNAAMQETLMEFIYAQEKSLEDIDQFKIKFDKQFLEKLFKIKKTVDDKYRKRGIKNEQAEGIPGEICKEKESGEEVQENV